MRPYSHPLRKSYPDDPVILSRFFFLGSGLGVLCVLAVLPLFFIHSSSEDQSVSDPEDDDVGEDVADVGGVDVAVFQVDP
jgi:hypothetical protein